ncbi:hypothetical protein PRIPAC_75630 [Pristionchus pacificus]|uniref:Protein kinase domain-containing protein n=1 Tax=Pristionchus pacificus TaxID=54126 RepID=A0A2A6CSS3_PRIPA|nr:hypothetical protein PRIPAC_75630 [Pristionchus pacificus]|eukprot:PDM81158.1 protein kinase [Pristionchus pacificus]
MSCRFVANSAPKNRRQTIENGLLQTHPLRKGSKPLRKGSPFTPSPSLILIPHCERAAGPSLTPSFSFSSQNIILEIYFLKLCNSTLSTWLSDPTNNVRDLGKMKSWFKQLLSAVAYIHEQGMIHRDLKPSNILLASDVLIKICDLGISASRKIIDDQEVPISRTNDRGTVKYMAPEQKGWAGYSAKVDIFSLGLILAELWVPMSEDLASTVFDNYRSGRSNTVLSQYPEVEHLVNWMTSVNDCDRPDCEEIAKHRFFSGLNEMHNEL